MMTLQKFVKLSSAEFVQLIRDEDTCEMYLDALARIDDFLCEFVPDREPPREADADSIVKDLTTIQTKIIGHTAIKQNIQKNLDVAQDLRNEALRMRQTGESFHLVETQIEAFLSESLEQYKSVAWAY